MSNQNSNIILPLKTNNHYDNNIDMIFHWGIYSVPAYDDITSAKGRKIQNGSEWYQKRLLEDGKSYPVSGYEETQKYHFEQFSNNKKYEDFADDFKAENYDPDIWMKLAKNIGCTSVILTSKHHDGYCLWGTETTKFNSVETGPKKD